MNAQVVVMDEDDPRFGLRRGDVLEVRPYSLDPLGKYEVLRRIGDDYRPECTVYRSQVASVGDEREVEGVVSRWDGESWVPYRLNGKPFRPTLADAGVWGASVGANGEVRKYVHCSFGGCYADASSDSPGWKDFGGRVGWRCPMHGTLSHLS